MTKRTVIMRIVIGTLLLMALAGCGASGEAYTTGDVILSESFSEPGAWETYGDTGIDLRVSDGVYMVQTGNAGYIWGLNEQSHDNVVIEVQTEQVSTFENNAYGVMCRADTSNNGDGYYFLISGDGYYSISRGEGDDVTPIIEWTQSSAIEEGTAVNTIRAVCIDDYLGLYVNDRFVDETRDSTYGSGYAGLAGTAFEDGDMIIHFDNLTIWEATLGGE